MKKHYNKRWLEQRWDARQPERLEPIFTGMIQAGSFPAWAVPSIDTKSAAPLISRAGFMAWVKDFYKLEKVYTKEDPKE